MHIITADGGFDFSIDFNRQEEMCLNLIFSQICFAIAMQKKNGHFIIKFFDCFTKPTVDLLYLLNSLYHKVYIMKPDTSRYANSERYIICKNFKYDNCDVLLDRLLHQYSYVSTKPISSIISLAIPSYFSNKLIEYNSIFGQQQIENISNTLTIIQMIDNQDKLNSLKKSHIQKCIKWCKRHNLPHNNTL